MLQAVVLGRCSASAEQQIKRGVAAEEGGGLLVGMPVSILVSMVCPPPKAKRPLPPAAVSMPTETAVGFCRTNETRTRALSGMELRHQDQDQDGVRPRGTEGPVPSRSRQNPLSLSPSLVPGRRGQQFCECFISRARTEIRGRPSRREMARRGNPQEPGHRGSMLRRTVREALRVGREESRYVVDGDERERERGCASGKWQTRQGSVNMGQNAVKPA